MSDPEVIELSNDAAVIYERDFVPMLFGEWGPRMADAAKVSLGERVLDVGCGTGVFAREAETRVGPDGHVVGIDLNESMLAVAKRMRPEIEWHLGDANSLPFDDKSFDVVGSQFVLMFIADRVGFVKEMWRTVAPGGRLAVAVWMAFGDALHDVALAEIGGRLMGPDAAKAFEAPYVLGNPDELLGIFHDAGLHDAELKTVDGSFYAVSIDEMIRVWVKGWVLAGIDDDTYKVLLAEAKERLQQYCAPDGSISMPLNAHIVTVTRTEAS